MHWESAMPSSPTSWSALMSCSYEAPGCVLNQRSNILHVCDSVSPWWSFLITSKLYELSPNDRPNLYQLLTWRCIRSFSSGLGGCEPKQGGTDGWNLKMLDLPTDWEWPEGHIIRVSYKLYFTINWSLHANIILESYTEKTTCYLWNYTHTHTTH